MNSQTQKKMSKSGTLTAGGGSGAIIGHTNTTVNTPTTNTTTTNNSNNNDTSSNTNNNNATTISNSNTGNSSSSNSNFPRRARRSIKAEGSILNTLLRGGTAKVIDASKLGKRLSSEIWNSFGAIQVEDDFSHPSIETRTVPDGSSTLKICQFFVACSRCFSVFKYDGHAYGTTGLVKHVKICQGNIYRGASNLDRTLSVQNSTTSFNSTSTLNGPAARRRKDTTSKARAAQSTPSLRYLARVIEELRSEQMELKQKIQEMLNLMSGQEYLGHIQVITNDGDKVVELPKAD